MDILDEGPHISIATGIVVGLLASFVQSLGLTIQRKSHVLNDQLPELERQVEHRRPLWLLGFVIFITSNILGSLFQIASLPVVILAPLGAVSLLWNAFFARLILGDVFSPWMIVGTLFIAGGAVLIGVFGTLPEPTRSLQDLLALFSRPNFIIYFSLLGVALAAVLVTTHILDHSLAARLRIVISHEASPPMSPRRFRTPAPPLVPSTTERTPLLDRKPLINVSRPSTPISQLGERISTNATRARVFLAVSYASVSGILSGMCLLFAKSGVQLLMLTVGGNNQFWQWQAWMLVLGLVAFALLQLWYLHKSLTLADPTLVCPLAFCFYNISSIVNGLVYFDQFSELPPLHLFLMILGMFVLLGGVWAISVQSDVEGGGVDVGTFQEPVEAVDEGIAAVTTGNPLATAVPPSAESALQRHTRLSTAGSSAACNSGELAASDGVTQPMTPPPASPLSPGSHHSSQEQQWTRRPSLALSPSRWKRPIVRRRFPSLAEVTDDDQEGTSSAVQPMMHMDASHLLPGGGLSIGLSPISPGFSIVPRRRLTVASGGDVERGLMRRTVSEGDVHTDPIVRGGPGGELVISSVAMDGESLAQAPPTLPLQGVRSRWGVLKGLGLRHWKAGRD